ncbi:MAG TPA: replicative DNA helicase [Pseudogracilibacillus sp.]|nr:replicative DNA helicase [Pseudogracilibacillus sp.]
MNSNVEAEKSVIGSILLEGTLFQDLNLQAEHFGDAGHKKIYEAMTIIADKELSIDVTTLATQLGEVVNQVGGLSYLIDLSSSVPSTESLKYYESLVFEAYRNRKSREVALNYAENPTDETLAELMSNLESLQVTGLKKEEKTSYDYLMEIAEDMAAPQEDAQTGFETGYTDYDNMTGGNQPADLIIVAARPSMGKTAFALNIASGHCENGGHSHVFSLEMGTKSLLQRMISSTGNINGQKWRSMNFSVSDYDAAMNAIGQISSWNLNINENTRTINDIKSVVRKAVQDYPEGEHLVIIDYLQLLSSTGRYENRNLEVGSMTRELKMLARELNIPFILLSQLSRAVEQRQDKRPMMSDLRESGNIEQDADVINFLYRDDYYDSDSEAQNITEIIISKQRNGPTGTVELAFQKDYGKFVSLDYRYGG